MKMRMRNSRANSKHFLVWIQLKWCIPVSNLKLIICSVCFLRQTVKMTNLFTLFAIYFRSYNSNFRPETFYKDNDVFTESHGSGCDKLWCGWRLSLAMRVLTVGRNLQTFSIFLIKIWIFIAIFGFSMKNALKWVQTSLVLVQWFLRQPF